jgi:hypothetical protein
MSMMPPERVQCPSQNPTNPTMAVVFSVSKGFGVVGFPFLEPDDALSKPDIGLSSLSGYGVGSRGRSEKPDAGYGFKYCIGKGFLVLVSGLSGFIGGIREPLSLEARPPLRKHPQMTVMSARTVTLVKRPLIQASFSMTLTMTMK